MVVPVEGREAQEIVCILRHGKGEKRSDRLRGENILLYGSTPNHTLRNISNGTKTPVREVRNAINCATTVEVTVAAAENYPTIISCELPMPAMLLPRYR